MIGKFKKLRNNFQADCYHALMVSYLKPGYFPQISWLIPKVIFQTIQLPEKPPETWFYGSFRQTSPF